MVDRVHAVDNAVPARDELDNLCDLLDPTREECEAPRGRCYLDDEAEADDALAVMAVEHCCMWDVPYPEPEPEMYGPFWDGVHPVWDWADGPSEEMIEEWEAEQAAEREAEAERRRSPQVIVGHQTDNVRYIRHYRFTGRIPDVTQWQAEADEQARYIDPDPVVPAVPPKRPWWRRWGA